MSTTLNHKVARSEQDKYHKA